MLVFIQINGVTMKLETAVEHFGNQKKIAEALDISEGAVSRWKERGGIVPIKVALRLVSITHGELSLRLRDY